MPQCPTDAIRIEIDPTFQAMGDARWTADLLVSTYKQAETGALPESVFQSETGASDGGFDRIRIVERDASSLRKLHGRIPHGDSI